jgi:serine/threonine-protein kinase
MNPFFSYDSRWVAYFTESGLFKVAVAGGVPERLVDVVGPNYEQGSWGPGDTIVMNYPVIDGSLHRGLAVVPASGGAARALTTPQRPGSHSEPELLPDGQTVLFTLTTEQTSSIATMPIAGGSFRVIVPNARTPKYVESGHLLFQRLETGEIVVVPFDITRLEVAGDAVTVDTAARVVDSAAFAVSQEGTLIYSTPSDTTEEADFALVSADRSGATTVLIKEHSSWAQPRVSPDGRFVVIRVVGNPNCDLWILDLQRGTRTRLTLENDNHDPVWHPNGREVTWAAQSDGPRLLTMGRADGIGQSRVLAPGKDSRLAESWSPDGRVLAFVEANPKTQEDIWFLSASDGEVRPFLTSRFQERHPAFSRDGRWLAYTSTESGREEVYLQAYGGNGGRVQISSNGGTGPVWSRNGRELFYAEGSQMMVVDIDLAGEPKVSRPRVLFQGPFVWERARNYDVTPDGRFVMVQRSSDSIQSATLRVLLNWQAKLGLR